VRERDPSRLVRNPTTEPPRLAHNYIIYIPSPHLKSSPRSVTYTPLERKEKKKKKSLSSPSSFGIANGV